MFNTVRLIASNGGWLSYFYIKSMELIEFKEYIKKIIEKWYYKVGVIMWSIFIVEIGLR